MKRLCEHIMIIRVKKEMLGQLRNPTASRKSHQLQQNTRLKSASQRTSLLCSSKLKEATSRSEHTTYGSDVYIISETLPQRDTNHWRTASNKPEPKQDKHRLIWLPCETNTRLRGEHCQSTRERWKHHVSNHYSARAFCAKCPVSKLLVTDCPRRLHSTPPKTSA